MIKKFLVLVLCGIMLVCLVACGKNDTVNNSSTKSLISNETISESKETNEQTECIFNTENIARIVFYAYYGQGKGSEVPSEYMPEIINWLGTFVIDEKVPELVPPGTNTVCVEIEYLDGTVIKEGLDTATVDGIEYYTKHCKEPECYLEILSHTSLS